METESVPPEVEGQPGQHEHRSLEGLHASVGVPHSSAGFWRQLKAFSGPAILISVGYMDPGNWSTDLSAGATFKYGLLWVVALSSLMAIFLQILASRLGVVVGKDLAQCCRDFYPKWTRWPNWLLCELAIAACDLAEVLGSALAIHLLFPKVSLLLAVFITALDVVLLLSLQHIGMRWIEALVATLVATIGVCYAIEIFGLSQTHPNFVEMGRSLLHPRLGTDAMTLLAIGIVGATVMPHNLYLHSALVQSRKFQRDDASIGQAIKFNAIDSTLALTIAFFVNAAILVLAALVFYGKDSVTVADGTVVAFNGGTDWMPTAYLTLAPLLGVAAASILFAIALLASGQSSTITGTLAGQVVMEGFMHWRIRPWVRRLITRALAITPAVLVIAAHGETHVTDLLNLSQIVLALQLPLAMFPLLHFVSSRKLMGKWKPGWFLLVAGWTSAVLITYLDIKGMPEAYRQAKEVIMGAEEKPDEPEQKDEPKRDDEAAPKDGVKPAEPRPNEGKD